jgi:phasin family protein
MKSSRSEWFTGDEFRIMTVKKIENTPRRPKITSSAVTPGRNRGQEPLVSAEHSETSNKREDIVDGLTEMTTDANKTVDNLTKTTERIMSYNPGNVEAIMKSGQIWAAGWQDIAKTLAGTTQAHLDQTMSTWKALASVKSLQEANDLRASLSHTSFETAFAETGKLTDASIKLVEQAMAPIMERFTLVVEKLTHPAP